MKIARICCENGLLLVCKLALDRVVCMRIKDVSFLSCRKKPSYLIGGISVRLIVFYGIRIRFESDGGGCVDHGCLWSGRFLPVEIIRLRRCVWSVWVSGSSGDFFLLLLAHKLPHVAGHDPSCDQGGEKVGSGHGEPNAIELKQMGQQPKHGQEEDELAGK